MNETSMLKLKYDLTDEYRQRRFVETGKMPEYTQTVDLDMATATPEQRAQILRAAGNKLEIDWSYSGFPKFAGVPDMAEFSAACQQTADKAEADRREKLSRDIDGYIAELLAACTDHNTHASTYHQLNGIQREDAERLGLDLARYDVVEAEYASLLPQFQAEHEAAQETARQESIAEDARHEAKKAAAEATKLDWISAYGSEHLRRAIAAGHDCNRKYLVERAALEYPGFVVDFENAADWKSRSCPSIEALDELDAINTTHPGASVEIVWLTAEPQDRKTDEREYYDAEQSEEREALVVNDPDYDKHNLIK